MSDTEIKELALSLQWAVTLRNIDSTPHIVFRVEHPRVPPLDFLLSSKDALDLAAALAKIAERRDEARIDALPVTALG